MRRLLVLLAAAAAVAAALRAARRRSESSPATEASMPEPQPPTPPSPTPTPAPPDREPEPEHQQEPERTTASAVSPAAETVKAVDVPAEAAPERPDSEVEREAEAQVAEVPFAEAVDVNVEVRDHIASIEGTAPDRETAMLIRDEVAHVDGVKGLEDRLVVEPGEASSPEPQERGAQPGEASSPEPRDRSADEDDA